MKRKHWILIGTSAGVVLLDQWTKQAVLEALPLHRSVQIIPGFFNLTHVRNTGGAFGIFGGERGGAGSVLFLAVSLIAILSILYFFVRAREKEIGLCLGLSLVLGGAIGNLIDRLRLGEVVDFLDFCVSSYHWPAFNVADSAICVGIGLLAAKLLTEDQKKSTKPRALGPKPKPKP